MHHQGSLSTRANVGRAFFLAILRNPEMATRLGLSEWDQTLSQGRRAGILARLHYKLEALDMLSQLPEKVREALRAECLVAKENKRALNWELNRLQRALSRTGVRVVILKGAAYAAAELPPSKGRVCSDVDILVAKDKLGVVEEALNRHGWEPVTSDEYDQHYYRSWIHELPPLRHKDRDAVVDVHHALVPETSRIRSDSSLLLESSIPLPGSAFQILAPADMVLHSATHLFQDEDPDVILRDLKDIDDLLEHFGREEFWDELLDRSRQLGLQRPLFYALRYAERLLGTPVPERVSAATKKDGPPWLVSRTMDALVLRAVTTHHATKRRLASRVARGFLYLHSHWLRMPFLLLTRHLLRKSIRRLTDRKEIADEAPKTNGRP